jgi:hypothetical protein
LHILAILLNFKQYFRATLEELYQNTTFWIKLYSSLILIFSKLPFSLKSFLALQEIGNCVQSSWEQIEKPILRKDFGDLS